MKNKRGPRERNDAASSLDEINNLFTHLSASSYNNPPSKASIVKLPRPDSASLIGPNTFGGTDDA